MPIIDVLIVGADEFAMQGGLSEALAQEFGRVLGAREGTLWVRVQAVPAAQYAENGPAPEELPVFLDVLFYELPSQAVLQGQAEALANKAGQVLGRRSGCVHIEFKPPGKGRVAFGGKLAL
jgi:hypothetical protein